MSPADHSVSGLHTKLAHWRVFRDLTQEEMAERTGIAPSTYRRLEQGDYGSRPDLKNLSNCAYALDCSLLDLIEDELLAWTPRGGLTEPPAPRPEWKAGPPPTLEAAKVGLKHSRTVRQARPKREVKSKEQLLRELEDELGGI